MLVMNLMLMHECAPVCCSVLQHTGSVLVMCLVSNHVSDVKSIRHDCGVSRVMRLKSCESCEVMRVMSSDAPQVKSHDLTHHLRHITCASSHVSDAPRCASSHVSHVK